MASDLTFADRLRELRETVSPYGGLHRSTFAERFGLAERALQDLEQGRSQPSRAMMLVVTAIEMDPEWMREVAKEAKADLDAIGRAKAGAGAPQ